MKKTGLLMIFLISCLVLTATTIQNENQKLIDSDGADSDGFGSAISVSGDYAVVGAIKDDDNGQDSGSAYIYHYNGTNWVEQQKLIPPDGAAGDWFGYKASISGDNVIIGCVGDDEDGNWSGSAYIYHYDGSSWIQQQKLTSSDACADQYFGCFVSISGDYAVVGAYGDGTNGVESGSVYIFHFNGVNWVEQQKLLPSDGAAGDKFGIVTSINNDNVIVGAYADGDGTHTGSAYIFHYDGAIWFEQQKLTPATLEPGDFFGIGVSIFEDRAIVGALGDDDNINSAGAAYVYYFDGTTWIEQQKLLASDGDEGDWLGYTVSITENYALLGANYDDQLGASSGSAYIYHFDGTSWNEQQKFLASDGGDGYIFGANIAMDNNRVLIGAPNAYSNAVLTGAAYFYEIADYILPPVNTQITIPANSNDEFNFMDADVRLQFTGNHLETTIDLTQNFNEPNVVGNLPANIVNIANNYWHVESSAGDVGTYDITFDLSEVEGIENFATLSFLKRDDDSSPWQDVVVDLGATLVYNYPYITIQGLNVFSEFVPAGGNDNSLPVTLSSFNASRTNSNFVELNWITKSETDMSGYNIFRNEMNSLNGALKVNTSIITASNLSTEHNYDFCDDEVELDNTYYYWLESVSMSGNTEFYGPVSVSLDDDKPEEFTKLGILGIYPNPFNPETNIDYSVKEETDVQVSVYNMKGQRVKTLVDKSVSAGDHNVVWHGDSESGKSVSSGVYFVKMITGNHIETRKIVLMK